MDKSTLISQLADYEPQAVVRTLAMMSYNPSIGRVLEEDGVGKFSDLAVEIVQTLSSLTTQTEFDAAHAAFCDRVGASFKTARGESVSYGQAQKPLNVFLKVYVDWAGKPDAIQAEKLKPLLHVPLDSLLMKFISHEFPGDYRTIVGGVQNKIIGRIAAEIPDEMRGRSDPKSLARRILGSEFSLSAINKPLYIAWQALLRSLYPAKPVLLDVVWAMERNRRDSD
jgi:hypothetical protein